MLQLSPCSMVKPRWSSREHRVGAEVHACSWPQTMPASGATEYRSTESSSETESAVCVHLNSTAEQVSPSRSIR